MLLIPAANRLLDAGTLVIFMLLLSQTSKTSPQTLHLLPPLLASSGAFLAFFFCSSISSSCFLHPPTPNNLFGLLTNHFVKELMNFVSLQSVTELPVHRTFPADPASVWCNFFYGWDLFILLSSQISFLIFASMSTNLSQRLFRLRLTSSSQVFADCFFPVFPIPIQSLSSWSPCSSTVSSSVYKHFHFIEKWLAVSPLPACQISWIDCFATASVFLIKS